MKTSNKETVFELEPADSFLQNRDVLPAPIYISLFILISIKNTAISFSLPAIFYDCRFARIPAFTQSYVLQLLLKKSIKENISDNLIKK